MKSLRRGTGLNFAWQQTAVYGLCVLAAGGVSLALGGVNALGSSLAASAVYVIPTVALLFVCRKIGERNPTLGANALQVGLLVRTFLATALIGVVALCYDGLNWPAFLLTLFTVVSAPAAGQVLLKK